MLDTTRRTVRVGRGRFRRTGFVGMIAVLGIVFGARPARADGEAWFWVENRVPIVTTDKPEFPRLDWRILSDTRFNSRSNGLAQAFLRTGPVFFPTSFMYVAVHGTAYAERLPTGAFDQEARIELEPMFFGRLSPDFTWSSRSRGEYRVRESGERFRYRHQLRLNYAPQDARFIPFVWDEVLVDLSGLGFNQNRFEVGLGYMIGRTTRLDVGYMVRSRDEATGWLHDHVLNVSLFFDVPSKAK